MQGDQNPFNRLFKGLKTKEQSDDLSVRPPTNKNYVVGEEKKDYTALVVAGGLGTVLLASASGAFAGPINNGVVKPVKSIVTHENTRKTLVYGGGGALAITGAVLLVKKLRNQNSRYTDYVVKSGDTLCSICETCGIDVEGVCRMNDIDDPNYIRTYDKLRLPTDKPVF